MLKAMLMLQWRASRHVVAVLAAAAFALPLASVHLGWHGSETVLPRFLAELQLWGLIYPILAALSGIATASAGWASDRRGHHVYALLHPITRARYVLLRYGAGAVLLMPVALAAWLGALAAVLTLDVPAGLRGFPNLLALKFGLALLVSYGIAFAVAASSRRFLGLAIRVAGVFLAIHLGVWLLFPKVNLLWRLVEALTAWPGPLSPLGGRWMLIDV